VTQKQYFAIKNDKDKKPWDINIDSEVDIGKSKSQTFQKLTGFLSDLFKKKEEKKEETEIRAAHSEYKKELDKANKDLDKRGEDQLRKDILAMIEKNLSRSFFKEVRLESFFETCFALKEPQKLMQEAKF
jgi:hypothetical protein